MQPHVLEPLRHPLQGPREPGAAGAGVIDLAGNGNPWGPAAAVRDRLLQAVAGGDDLRHPAPADGLALREAIALRRGVHPGQVILGNGSTELLGIAARAMLGNGGSGLAARHAFPAFERATRAAGGRFIEGSATALEVDAEHLLAAVQADTRIVFLGHPDSPTGTRLERAALARLARSLRPDILLVVDQAYAEYEDPETYPSAAAHLAERENLLVLHTFSKIHGLAGLRIGYGLAHPGLAGRLERVRGPLGTSHLAQVAAEAAVPLAAFEAACRARNQAARSAFLMEAGRHRCRVSGLAGNFLLLETVYPAQELFRDLLHRGVQVCPADRHGLPNHVRVSMGTPQEMSAFWKAAGPILDNLGCGCS